MRPARALLIARVLKKRSNSPKTVVITLADRVSTDGAAMGCNRHGINLLRGVLHVGHNRRCPQNLDLGREGNSHGAREPLEPALAATTVATARRLWIGWGATRNRGGPAAPPAPRFCRWNLLIIWPLGSPARPGNARLQGRVCRMPSPNSRRLVRVGRQGGAGETSRRVHTERRAFFRSEAAPAGARQRPWPTCRGPGRQ